MNPRPMMSVVVAVRNGAATLPAMSSSDGHGHTVTSSGGRPWREQRLQIRVDVDAVGAHEVGLGEFLGQPARLLVPPADADALGRAIDRLMDDPALRRRLGDNARATVESRFDVARHAVQRAA